MHKHGRCFRPSLFCCLILLTTTVQSANAQNVEFTWAADMGGLGDFLSNEFIATDASGNAYTTGWFQGTVDFDPGPGVFNLTSAGRRDIFVQKLDSSGNFLWAKAMGDPYDDYGTGIAVDASGNVYTTGSFLGTVDFDPGAGTANLASWGGGKIFIQKLDASGDFLWAKLTSGIQSGGIVLDTSGHVYTTGGFRGVRDFDAGPGVFNLTSAGADDIFIQKLDGSGNFLWAKSMGGGFDDYGRSITLDASGNVYTTGAFLGTADFDPGAGTSDLTSAAGSRKIFVSKLDASGNFVWAVSMDGGYYYNAGWGLSVDASGNVYTTGTFKGTTDFDPGPGVVNLTSANSGVSYDIFVSKLDASGNFLWAKQMGAAGWDAGSDIAVDASGSVYTTGYFYYTVDFDPGAGAFNLTSAGGFDIFVLKLDSDGNFVWAKAMGGTGWEKGQGIVVDTAGHVYTTGWFRGTTDFDPGAGAFNLTSESLYSSADVFVQKLSPSPPGVVFESAERIGGTGNDQGHDAAVDTSGNVYTTGFFEGTTDFDPGAGTFNLTSMGGNDIFVQKLDASDNFVWAKAMGGTSNDGGHDTAVDPSGNVYTTGAFQGTVDFDPGAGTFNLTSAGSNDIFVSKLDASGNFAWAKAMGGTGSTGSDVGLAIAVDAPGNVYTTGYFNGTADFDPGAGVSNLTSAGNRDIFISKLDASGNFMWAKAMGGTSSDVGYDFAVDTSGNVYITGSFQGTVDFDPGAGTATLTSAGDRDVFIQKLDASGNFTWAKQIGDTSSDAGLSITVDALGNVYTTGFFEGATDFDPGAGTFNLTSAGNWDIFIQKLDASGNFLWAKRMGGTLFDSGDSIAVDASGNAYTTGSFSGTTDFDPGAGTFNLTSAGSADIFVSQLDASGEFMWAKQMGGTGYDTGHSIAVDASGTAYTTGWFQATADFDPGAGTFNLTSAGIFDVFISKLSSDTTPPVITVDTLVTNDTTPELTGTIDDASAVIHVTVSGPWPTQTHPATNNGATWTLADNILSSITPGIREVTVTAWDSSGYAGTDATYNELTILGAVAGEVTSNLDHEETASGARLELTAPTGTNYQWKRDGVNLTDSPPRVTGTTSQTFIIDPLEALDSGSYTVEYQATTRASGFLETDPFDVVVDLFDFPGSSPPPALPTAALQQLMVLALLLVLTGVWSVTRRRARER